MNAYAARHGKDRLPALARLASSPLLTHTKPYPPGTSAEIKDTGHEAIPGRRKGGGGGSLAEAYEGLGEREREREREASCEVGTGGGR